MQARECCVAKRELLNVANYWVGEQGKTILKEILFRSTM